MTNGLSAISSPKRKKSLSKIDARWGTEKDSQKQVEKSKIRLPYQGLFLYYTTTHWLESVPIQQCSS